MTETLAVLIAATVALYMVALVRAGITTSLRTAMRTTTIVILGWLDAMAYYGPKCWSALPWQVQGMLLVSATAVGFSWLLHFRMNRPYPNLPASTADRLNVIFAVIFAGLFVCESPSSRSALIAVLIVSGALILAFGLR